MHARRVLVATAVLAGIAFAANGGDVAALTTQAQFSCAQSNGWQYMIARSYHSYGAADEHVAANLQNAKAAGIQYTDIYHFPCSSVAPATQIAASIAAAGKGNFGTLWLDIETNPSPGCGWSSDWSANCKFVSNLINAAQVQGATVGIFTSQHMWDSFMGGESCNVGSANGLPLWYAHFDQSQSFSDFTPFAGWVTPAMKQYWDSVSFCGITADADWYP